MAINEKELLARYLECAYKESSESKKELDRYLYRKERELGAPLTHWEDGKVVKVRELLQAEAIESTTLVQTQLHNTITKGADYAKCVRDAVPVERNAKGPTHRFVTDESTASSTAYAPKVAEGAEIPPRAVDYSNSDVSFVTIGERIPITRALVEDQRFDAVAKAAQNLGKRVENTLNYDTVDSMLENSGLEHDCTGSNLGLKALNAARTKVLAAGFMPDSAIVHPEFAGQIINDLVPSDYYGGEKAFNTGNIGYAIGLKLYTWGGTTSGTTYTWDYDGDGDIGAIVYDSEAAAGIAFARDLTIERYEQPIRDLTNAQATMRYAASYIQANAIARVEY